MNQSSKPIFDLRDLAHAAVLLILVPVVFYGGYQLVSHSADTDTSQENLGIQTVDKVKKRTTSWLNEASPPPGIEWIAEIDRLRTKLSAIIAIDSTTIQRQNRLNDQLTSFRQHCQTFTNEVHATVDRETHLGRTLLRLANEIEGFQSQVPQSTRSIAWKSEFEAFESKRLDQQASFINSALSKQAAPMRQAHATQLASVARRNRELADELQRTLDSIEQIESSQRIQLVNRRRLEAYAKDEQEIARLLTPFITPGYSQLGTNWNDWNRNAEKKPLSYRDLERLGALAPDIKGIRMFARIGGMPTHMSPNSARPLGSFPAYYDSTLSNPSQLESIKRAQQLLKKHSAYLIEAGLLQP